MNLLQIPKLFPILDCSYYRYGSYTFVEQFISRKYVKKIERFLFVNIIPMVNKPTYKIHTIVLKVNKFRYDDKQKNVPIGRVLFN